ncbi:alpha/beta fold hydrolase [Baekduia soli]|uniref:Alpha/beta fold hydrolase n=1 Tax=Baekduia soli TaxID=496014 RepID=A0A5B8U3Y7_9ACTN|nr:alpha/beta fold hydrolase [Baekduia soli]QEC47595.1 alpha/beta fold hydrolase [Baekduia soli]
MDERFAEVGRGITLCHETFGDPSAPPVLLIMGLGMQMIGWDDRFCAALADRGFQVTRFDNRDAGRSTHLDGAPVPRLRQLVRRRIPDAPYRLADMALDTAGLLSSLGLQDAHVVGASMGGMIAQTLAARHPQRVRSLTSIMSSTGALLTGQPALRSYPVVLGRAPRDREAYVEHALRMWARIGSPGFDRDEDELRAMVGRGYDRAFDPRCTARQLGAIIASGDRRRELRAITAPTLVIHGEADRLVAPSGGRATARAIPGARLLTIPGMGHDLPSGAWPQILRAIEDHARAADAGAPARRAAA